MFGGVAKVVAFFSLPFSFLPSNEPSGPNDHATALATHRTHLTDHGLEYIFYHPESTYVTFGDGIDHPLSHISSTSYEDAAISFLVSKGIPADQIAIQSSTEGHGTSHVYLKQRVNGIEVANAVANVSFKKGKIIAFGHSFVAVPDSLASQTISVSQVSAINVAQASLGGQYNDWPIKQEYVFDDNHNPVLTYVIEITNDSHHYQVFVDVTTGDIVNVIDFSSKATYRALPIQYHNPLETQFQLIRNPEDTGVSTDGWHKVRTTTYEQTRGNNADVFFFRNSSNSSPTSGKDVFDYSWARSSPPHVYPNLDVARVNAFYTVNKFHDVLYRYGWTERSYNLQAYNFGRGGAENDPLKVEIQPGQRNDAFIRVPGDGQSARMTLGIFFHSGEGRDSALSNDVIIHELGHAITFRMVGGGSSRCLGTLESAGMSEGWGDAYAYVFEQKNANVFWAATGEWLMGRRNGIRRYPYSTDFKYNPLTYGSLRGLREVHDIGEVWAEALFEVFAILVGRYGFNPQFENPSSGAGNNIWLRLVTQALLLTPCNPTFLHARDAILQADASLYGGANRCLLWRAFAKRGFGTGARQYTNHQGIPSGC